jgi:uncharacterized membrane protein
MFYAVLKLAHVLTVVLWIGGMAFAHFFLRPALPLLEPPQRLKLMHAVLARFFTAVSVAVALLLASGLWMIGLFGRSARATVEGGAALRWPLDWIVMTALGVVMIGVFAFIRLVLFRRFGAALAAGDNAGAAAALARIRAAVGVNLGIGVAVIAVTLLL